MAGAVAPGAGVGGGAAADDRLARPVGVLRGRVGDHVLGSSFATEATVVGVAEGPRLFSEASDDRGVPTQRIALRAGRRIYGRVPTRIVLFKTGSPSAWGDGDPPYAVGERYLIFATRRPENDGTFLNAGPDGRIRVVGGILESLIPGRISQALAGLTIGEAGEIARRAHAVKPLG